MREIVYTHQYKHDVKRARRRHLPEKELDAVIQMLANDTPLPPEKRDHALSGEFAGARECHIHPDWLLIYSKENLVEKRKGNAVRELRILNLLRTGTHSDLF